MFHVKSSSTEEEGGTNSPKTLSIQIRLAFKIEEIGSFLRNTNDQGTHYILSYLVTSLYLPTTYTENDDIGGKGKIGKPIVSFPFSPSLFISKLKVECLGETCACQEVEYSLCSISTALVRTNSIGIY